MCKNSENKKRTNFGENIGEKFGHKILKQNFGKNLENIRV
jgi:hypothetical protein